MTGKSYCPKLASHILRLCLYQKLSDIVAGGAKAGKPLVQLAVPSDVGQLVSNIRTRFTWKFPLKLPWSQPPIFG